MEPTCRSEPLSVEGQTNLDRRPFSDAVTGDRDGALVPFDEPVDEREADAQSALSAVERAIDLSEQLEDVWQHFGWNPHAVILDIKYKF